MSFEKNQSLIKKEFEGISSKEALYKKIMQLGEKLPPLEEKEKTPSRLVPGCQSRLYLKTEETNGKIFFQADADALISKGIAYLLIVTYQGLSAEEILKSPPTYLDALGIYSSLSMNRAQGLSSLYLKMKKDALHFLLPI